jgi:hypothetical protein
MVSSRRSFLGFTTVWTAAVAVGAAAQGRLDGAGRGAAQGRQNGDASSANPPSNDPSNDPFDDPGAEDPKFNPRQLLEANQKGIKKDVERLSEVVQQLQKQLEDKDTKDVLSLDVIRQTDEIERLAKHIRALVRG